MDFPSKNAKNKYLVYFRAKYAKILCGIVGIWGKSVVSEKEMISLRNATSSMRRRGPDHEGLQQFDRAAFGHRRLAIIDTDVRSNQPMVSDCGRYVLVYNGEIHNYRQLRSEMEMQGEKFRTSGDTEVLLRGLMRRGRRFLNDLNGFFSIGFYDGQTHELLLARDRYGIKPLYCSHRHDRFYFSSTLEGLMELGVPRRIDRRSLSVYLQLTYVPAPLTMLEEAQKALPGEWISISDKGIEKGLYYSLPQEVDSKIWNEVSAANRLRELLGESIQARLAADVPVGAFLSGGIDSAVIADMARRVGVRLPTFSIGFPDQPYFDESQRAAETARHLGLEHHIHEIRESDLAERPEMVLDAFDEPFADSSAVLVNLLSEFASRHVKVALSGDGADEIFGGYNKHRALLHSMSDGAVNRTLRNANGLLKMLPSSRNHGLYNRFRKLKRYGRGLQLSFEERYWEWACFTSPAEAAALLGGQIPPRPDFLNEMLATLDTADFNSVLRMDMRLVLANDMLYKVDRMSMHHGLEVRVPFLDHNLVDFLFSLPASLKMDGKVGKRLLRDAFAGQFPEGHFSNKKKGFEAPLTHWFHGPLKSLTADLLNSDRLNDENIFDAKAVSGIRARVSSRSPGDAPHSLWAILVFQYWHAKYIDQTTILTNP